MLHDQRRDLTPANGGPVARDQGPGGGVPLLVAAALRLRAMARPSGADLSLRPPQANSGFCKTPLTH